jgi:NhaA family Na+:H+ antiporter
MLKKRLITFFKSEISVGILLMLAAIAALAISNSQNFAIYQNFFSTPLPLRIDFLNIYKDLNILAWINDGAMALFFLLVGLELKKEILSGELSSRKKIALPAIAAFGGVIFPILIFVFLNSSQAENLRGFAIPAATDIAFAYGLVSLFGKKISNSLKVFLIALAILDDLVAIILIAFFYAAEFNIFYFSLAFFPLVALLFLNLKNSNKISFYLFFGIFLWLMILKSGIHATLSGVILAFFIPLKIKEENLLKKLAHQISPIVNFLILPLFAFANAGVKIAGFSPDFSSQSILFGSALGLFFGKQLGVMLFSFLAVKLKIADLPRGANWLEFYAIAVFTGIGFTMSLFIAELAFYNSESSLLNQAKIGILFGSLISAIWGILITLTSLWLTKNFKRS